MLDWWPSGTVNQIPLRVEPCSLYCPDKAERGSFGNCFSPELVLSLSLLTGKISGRHAIQWECFMPIPRSRVSPVPPPLSRRKWTHGCRPSPPPSPLINTRCLPAPRARQHPVGRRPCPPVSSPSPANPVPANGRRTKRKTKRSGSAFLAKRSELLSFTSCPSLTFSVKFQHASSEPTHYSLCLTFLNVVDFFFFF